MLSINREDSFYNLFLIKNKIYELIDIDTLMEIYKFKSLFEDSIISIPIKDNSSSLIPYQLINVNFIVSNSKSFKYIVDILTKVCETIDKEYPINYSLGPFNYSYTTYINDFEEGQFIILALLKNEAYKMFNIYGNIINKEYLEKLTCASDKNRINIKVGG